MHFGTLEVDTFASHLNHQVRYHHHRVKALDVLAPGTIVHIPSDPTPSQSDQKNQTTGLHDSHHPIMVPETVVLHASRHVSKDPTPTHAVERYVTPGSRVPPAPAEAAPDPMALERRKLLGLGLSK